MKIWIWPDGVWTDEEETKDEMLGFFGDDILEKEVPDAWTDDDIETWIEGNF